MPYWSSSRVGAVPQPSKPKKRNERYNLKKGITMEDLKKQTAIRLAQEQHQNQGIQGAPGSSFAPPQDSSGVVQTQAVHRSNYHTTESNHHHPTHNFHSNNSSIVPPPPTAADDPYHPALVTSYRYDPNHAVSGISSHSDSSKEPLCTPVKQSPARSFQEHQRSAPRPTKSSSSDASATKAKLPHGLTVHELKEMTKARLQAEASEKREVCNNPEPPLIPSVVRASPEYREALVPSPTMSSPVPPPNFGRNARSPYPEARSPFPEANFPPQLESWSHDSRNDLWENGSVSTQTSDYIGSEHAFGVASFNGDESGFHRAGSFPSTNAPPPRDVASPAMGLSQSPGLYEFVPNRRRAATLSPRVGLSHLHEDRPFLPGQELPGLPSFHTGNFNQALVPPDRFLPGVIGNEGNRARTSSAVSLPAMSHTAEEFAEPQRLFEFPEAQQQQQYRPPAVTGLSDVFRQQDALRERASTWEPTSSPSDLFGPGLLADDLASILKLSGAEEKDD